MAGLSPAIDKLIKKLEKEPNSLIFLQLAEEHRKEGSYEEALKVCRDGLRRHPNYWSARVAMGRIYHEMGENDKAREELERVAKAVPDNLLANKLLGDIYLESNRLADALKRYQLVQMLTPTDQEVISNIQKIETALSGPGIAVATPTIEVPPPARTMVTPRPVEPVVLPPKADLYAGLEKTDPGVRIAEPPAPPTVILEPPAPPAPAVQAEIAAEAQDEEDGRAEEELAAILLDVGYSNDPARLAPPAEETAPPPPSVASPAVELPGTPPDRRAAAAVARPEDITQPMEEKEVHEAGEEEADELTTQTLAELYVQQGLTEKALRVYQKLLLNDPGNKQIVQRLKDLSPRDSLLTTAAEEARGAGQAAAPIPSARTKEAAPAVTKRESNLKVTDLSTERQRKITTLENWLASIRRERS